MIFMLRDGGFFLRIDQNKFQTGNLKIISKIDQPKNFWPFRYSRIIFERFEKF